MDDHRIARLELQQDLIVDKLQTLNVTMAENTMSLKEHMAQTLEVRKQTGILTEMFSELKVQTEQALDFQKELLLTEIKPLQKFVDRAKFGAQMICYTGGLILGLEKLGVFAFLFNLILEFHKSK